MVRKSKKIAIKRKPGKPGRKGYFKDEMSELAYKLCAILGAKDRQLAAFFGVEPITIELWKRNKPEFKEAVDKGKLIADANVAKAYYQRAIGYSHPDTVILTNRVTEYGEDGKPIRSYNEPLIVPTVKHYPPDSFACLKWLTARQRETWADIAEVHHKHSGQIEFKKIEEIPIEDFTEQEQELLFNIGLKQIKDGSVGRN